MRDIRDPDDPRHGTMAGYSAHRRAPGSGPCDRCKRARRDSQGRYDLGRPEVPCEVCGTATRSRHSVCASCRQKEPKREPIGCSECGTYTVTQGDLCAYCQRYGAATLKDADLLLDGWWVRNGLTLKWVSAA